MTSLYIVLYLCSCLVSGTSRLCATVYDLTNVNIQVTARFERILIRLNFVNVLIGKARFKLVAYKDIFEFAKRTNQKARVVFLHQFAGIWN